MQAMIVFFVAMVCGALAAEPAKVESKYAYPAGVYPYPAVAPVSPFVVHDYQAYPYNLPVAAPYPYYPVVAAQPNKVSEKTSDVEADKVDDKYYVAYPYGAYPYLQAKQA